MLWFDVQYVVEGMKCEARMYVRKHMKSIIADKTAVVASTNNAENPHLFQGERSVPVWSQRDFLLVMFNLLPMSDDEVFYPGVKNRSKGLPLN